MAQIRCQSRRQVLREDTGWRLVRCNLKIAVTDVMEPVHSQVLLTPSAYNSQVLFTLES